ncbi:unnamed protein product [Vitrella brassicaformis CCMP3155]|uniref:Uncharacterized protein n=1 Tax=Vitrella brassicaformis (strain CCMP3155) TaxID=1169540 RepID=A0A0G4FSS2_VITBC|nr:unnamed protein product [Vitrella brassicaformis CCMP3155]|eukprot:CEM17491.1 unnamed protein product [Vitrella brassicaformis CCMP3155]
MNGSSQEEWEAMDVDDREDALEGINWSSATEHADEPGWRSVRLPWLHRICPGADWEAEDERQQQLLLQQQQQEQEQGAAPPADVEEPAEAAAAAGGEEGSEERAGAAREEEEHGYYLSVREPPPGEEREALRERIRAALKRERQLCYEDPAAYWGSPGPDDMITAFMSMADSDPFKWGGPRWGDESDGGDESEEGGATVMACVAAIYGCVAAELLRAAQQVLCCLAIDIIRTSKAVERALPLHDRDEGGDEMEDQPQAGEAPDQAMHQDDGGDQQRLDPAGIESSRRGAKRGRNDDRDEGG